MAALKYNEAWCAPNQVSFIESYGTAEILTLLPK
jgi:hypothetical protein